MDLAAVSCTEQPRGTSRERQGRDTGLSVSFELSFKHPQPRLAWAECEGIRNEEDKCGPSDGDIECLDRVSEESELGTLVKV